MSKGYITTAFGASFIQDAYMLCSSIKKYESALFAVLTDVKTNVPKKCFDKVILYDTDSSIKHPHERYNVDVMLHMNSWLPFDETIFVDSDIIRTKPDNLFIFFYEKSKAFNQSVLMFGKKKDCKWHFGTVCQIERQIGVRLSHTHAGIIYLRRGHMLNEFFRHANFASNNYDNFHFLRLLKAGSKALEIHLSYAMGKMNWYPIEFSRQNTLCFNANMQTGNGIFSHVHMFNREMHHKLYYSPSLFQKCNVP